MLNVVTRSKYVNETIPITWDFSDLLQVGETISSVTVVVTLFSGVDSNPSNILYNAPIIAGTQVTQNVRLGIPGCNYEIVFQVYTATHIYEKSTNLAILPLSGQAIPSFTVIYEDTCLYPYELENSIKHSLLWLSGKLLGIYVGPEGVIHTSQWVSGNISGATKTYTIPFEAIKHSLQWISGSLSGTSKQYNIPFESITNNLAWLSGSLSETTISYKIPFDSFKHTMTWNSGTLS